MSIKLVKIVLNINGNNVEVTIEEAEKLYNELHKIFHGDKSLQFPPYPIYPWPRVEDKWVRPHDVTFCSSTH